MILPIYTEPNPILHQECAVITEVTDEIRQLAEDMRLTMHNAIGVGLAAPQVGKAVQMLVIELIDDEEPEYSIPFMVLINPRITWHSLRKVEMQEACLSIPGVEGPVRRPDKIRVNATNLDNERITIEADGLVARVLQHEIDHLHGALFTDHVPKKKLHTRPLVDYPML